MIRSLWLLRTVDPGFDSHNVLTAVVALPRLKYSAPEQKAVFFRQVLGHVRALPGDVLRFIVLDGMKPTLLGIAIALAGAFALGRVVASLIYGVTPAGALTFALVSLLLTTVGFFACIVPAYRATRIEPSQTLRMA